MPIMSSLVLQPTVLSAYKDSAERIAEYKAIVFASTLTPRIVQGQAAAAGVMQLVDSMTRAFEHEDPFEMDVDCAACHKQTIEGMEALKELYAKGRSVKFADRGFDSITRKAFL